mgnify:CR=1 FL=1
MVSFMPPNMRLQADTSLRSARLKREPLGGHYQAGKYAKISV